MNEERKMIFVCGINRDDLTAVNVFTFIHSSLLCLYCPLPFILVNTIVDSCSANLYNCE